MTDKEIIAELIAVLELFADPENWHDPAPMAIPVKPWDIARAVLKKARGEQS